MLSYVITPAENKESKEKEKIKQKKKNEVNQWSIRVRTNIRMQNH